MATAGCYERSRKRKRKKHRKLLPGEHVEVLYTDEGLRGSWHIGVVVDYGVNTRLIEYANLLSEDNCSKLRESVPVCAAIEGFRRHTSEDHRGHLRPLPPHYDVNESDIKYGLCVDALIDDAWWEGVIFDRADGSKERLVFFPDQGDQVKVSLDQLRVTQEWNEVSEHWKPRGTWLLLQVLETFELEEELPVSVREIWYDLRTTAAFPEKIGEWIFGSQSMWHTLVSELVEELRSVIRGAIISSEFPSDFDPIEDFPHRRKDITCGNTDLPVIALGAFRSFEHCANGSFSETRDMNTEGPKKTRRKKVLSLYARNGANKQRELVSQMTLDQNVFESANNFDHRESWILVDLKAEYHPEAVKLCASEDGRLQKKEILGIDDDRRSVRMKARKHLIGLGWRIEARPIGETKISRRFRFLSPEGKTYYSLPKACCSLLQDDATDCLNSTINELVSANIHTSSYLQEHFLMKRRKRRGEVCSPDETSKTCRMVQPSSIMVDSDMINYNDTEHLKDEFSKDSETVSPVFDDLEPGSFPEAVLGYKNYLDLSRGKQKHGCPYDANLLRLKARRHLKFMGWKFWIRGENRKELFITSPIGRPFRSLYSACDEYLREERSKNRSKAAKLSVFSQPTDTLVREKHRKSKRLKVVSKFSSFPFATLGGRELKHLSVKKSERRKGARSSKKSMVLQSPSQRVPRTILSLLIDNDMILPRQKVRYIRKRDGHVLREGHVTRHGIKCTCCKVVYTLSNFEAHAGSTYRRPAASIFLSDGRSLLQCQMQLVESKKPKDFVRLRLKCDYSQYKSDTVCSACRDAGSLLLCDHCPSSFHLSCVGLQNVPKGKWFCPYCRCGVCGRSEFNSDIEQFTERTVVCCDQCEREYHVGCMRKGGNKTLSRRPVGNWFCNASCSKIFLHLRRLLGKSKLTAVKGLSWTLLRSSRANGVDTLQFDTETIAEHDSKLCVALNVLNECFATIIDPYTKSDLVADILFNKESELRRVNFYGFYTMLLERGDELISVATFRVLGEKIAEMPFIGTRVKYRRQGMCRLLVNELEKLLVELGVERLILPAIPQLLQAWTSSFGFSKISNSEKVNLSQHAIINFHESTMCEKLIRDPAALADQKGEHKESADTSRSIDHIDSEHYNDASQVVEMSEPIKVLPSLWPCSSHTEDHHMEHTSSPSEECIGLIDEREPYIGPDPCVLANDAPGKCANNLVSDQMPPTGALKLQTCCDFEFLRQCYNSDPNNSSFKLIKSVNDGQASSFKYFYKRRIAAKKQTFV